MIKCIPILITGVLSLLGALLALSNQANAAIDHKTFEKCYNMVVPEIVKQVHKDMPDLKQSMENNVMAGNYTTSGGEVDRVYMHVYDCMKSIK